MDSSFAIKPPPGIAQTRAVRDPVTVRAAVDTELVGSRTVGGASGRGEKDDNPKQDDQHGTRDHESRTEHAPQDLVADPDSRDVIYRERDVRASDREHPDHALMRLRAYRPAILDEEPAPSPADPHADIRA
jgi:hypothetical protein